MSPVVERGAGVRRAPAEASLLKPYSSPRMISVRDAARILGVCPATVRRNLPLQRLGDRTLIRIADVRKITGEVGDV